MLVFFAFASCHRLAVGIWAGKETLNTRVKAQASTWMRQFPAVNVFSDEIPDGACEKLQELAFPCKLRCIALGNLAEHLEDTEWEHRWYFAQPRFLPAMATLYELDPKADFFLFGDDDTYFIYPTIQDEIQKFNQNTPNIFGKFWCAWQKVAENIPPKVNCHPFAQGGAGVMLSNEFMKQISPHLRNCSLQFNDPDFAGSMRFAICAERVVGIDNWKPGKIIVDKARNFHSSPPAVEIADRNIDNPVFSFHRIKEAMFPQVQDAHLFKNASAVFDLGRLAFRQFFVPIGSNKIFFEWRFGHAIYAIGGINPLLPATSQWVGEFTLGGDLFEIHQQYGEDVTIKCVLDKEILPGNVIFDHFEDVSGFVPVFRINKDDIFIK